MKKNICTFILCLLIKQALHAQQQTNTDSANTLTEITVTAFEQKRAVSSGTIVKILTAQNTGHNNKASFVNSFNTIAGVRMEERSPGSYRINIRGSSLRSPFGVRNIKVYWNNIPITDAGGNTYFNQFAFNNIATAEIVKGPAGSMYGAGTGGLLLLHPFTNSFNPNVAIEYITGSYGLHNIVASANYGNGNSRSQITFAHNQSDGYRNHTQTKRDNASFTSQIKITDKHQLTAAILYSSLFYETPGALNKAEFTSNPKMARPAAGGFPSAQGAKAAIYQKNFTAGITQQYSFTNKFKNTTTLFGSFAQVRNPTFRNYERRNEPGFGGRTSFNYTAKIKEAQLQWVTGAEVQKAYFNTQVSKNKNGNADTLLTNDDIDYTTYSIFSQATLYFKNNWVITAAASINKSSVIFSRLNSYPVQQQSRSYKNEISPRLALQKKLQYNTTIFTSVSKGFSPPTIAELLPSTGVISTFLQAEQGINYEAGVKTSALKNKLVIELTAFYFKLNNALVSRKDSSNADYFVNAGSTNQKGIELSADYATVFKTEWLKSIVVNAAHTLHSFKYSSFKKGITDFSGKYLPGVPQNTFSLVANIALAKGIYINGTYYAAAKTFLDDANSATAAAYDILGLRLGCRLPVNTKHNFNFYLGTDNLLNKTYSLGNDINAAAGRYYNAAPKRNLYAGFAVQFNTAVKK
jgi:iron complex outermembrane recepter protein